MMTAAARRTLTMAAFMRERWTEAEVLALPAGEHNYFERKRGAFLTKGDWRDSLSKVLSAFANFGGGHIVIGVHDDGHIDGVEVLKTGRTSTRDWLEQVIPDCLSPPLANFRVHTVVPAVEDTTILGGRVVIVIDVGDSVLAPHQAEKQRVYFYREGGRSEPAPHVYLEAIRTRLIGPLLVPVLMSLELTNSQQRDDQWFIEMALKFVVRNEGNLAAYKWAVALDELKVGGKHRRARPVYVDHTLLPGEAVNDTEHRVGFLLPRLPATFEEAVGQLDQIIADDGFISYRAVSEVSRGEVFRTRLKDLDLRAFAAQIKPPDPLPQPMDSSE
jgi:schlafen family protein